MSECARIRGLPRRDWRERIAPYIGPLTQALRAPNGSQTIRPAQAAIVVEAGEQLGLIANGRVGIGKTFAAAAAPLALRRKLGELRVLSLMPGGIKKATIEHLSEIRQHWQIPIDTVHLSYTAVSRMPGKGESIGDLFGKRGPNVIVCDEADALRGVGPGGSALARQIESWIVANPDTVFIIVTGTLDVDGLLDYAHLFDWALRDGSPLPRDPEHQAQWAAVIDRGDLEKAPWVCQDLGIPIDSGLDAIREAYRLRVLQTPGVIIADDPFTDVPLTVREHAIDPGAEEHFERLRTLWQRPDELDLLGGRPDDADRDPDRIEGGTVWQVARRMARGLCYICDPRPPEWWLAPRRAYSGWVRKMIESGAAYTELQARQLALSGGAPSGLALWEAWERVRDKFEPRQKTLWLSDAVLDWCIEWGRRAPGLIWADDIAFGVELSRRTGWEYYAGKGRSASGRLISDAPAGRTAIASRKACGTGRNLQHQWSRCLFPTPVTKSRDFEQNVGRLHREGQKNPVHADILLACREDYAAQARMIQSARRCARTMYAQKAAHYTWERLRCPPDGWAFVA